MRYRLLEYLLVIVQFTTIGYALVTTSWHLLSGWALAVIGIALFLAIWAILTMQPNNVKITPSPMENARLVTQGPYRFIRHPMYTSLLLVMIPLVIAEFSPLRLALGLMLLTDLLVKLRYEEKLLKKKFQAYDEYCMHTRRLIPFIW